MFQTQISQQSFYKEKMTDRKLWTCEEDEAILTLINQYGTTQWTTIATEMRTTCNSSRSSKQIRERWYNQLSPNIVKGPWQVEEEEILFQAHSSLGNKWKDLARLLPGRTDNSVKNHFYSTVRRALRRLDKHFGFKESTKKMRSLKPATLTHLLQAARTLADYSQMMVMLLQFAQWKPSRKNKQQHPERGRQLYQNIIEMISNYNQNYRRGKNSETLIAEQLQEQSSALSVNNIDNLSIISNGDASIDQYDCQLSNYFGSVTQTRSWFNVHDRQQSPEHYEQHMQLLCDQDNCE